MSQPVKLVCSSPSHETFEETGVTNYVSREGFYFLTMSEHNTDGMRMRVTMPYYHPPDRRNRECMAQVVRVELFPSGQRGVAV
jgi:hypothetical protein